MTIKCDDCGRFISYEEIELGLAKLYFEPASHFGPEINEWSCRNCAESGNLYVAHKSYMGDYIEVGNED